MAHGRQIRDHQHNVPGAVAFAIWVEDKLIYPVRSSTITAAQGGDGAMPDVVLTPICISPVTRARIT